MNLSSNNLATSTPIKTATTTSTTEYPYAQGSGTPPPGSTTKFPTAADDKKSRRTSLQVLLPKLPSSDSLSNSPGPASPGLSNWNDNSPKVEGSILDKTSDASKLNRKESYKAQRKNYRREKKRVASELLNSLQDPAVIVLADWLKVRGTLKSWTKLWCVLKPGLLFLYKSPKTKSSHWVGTILLTSCQAIERPSKKDGFCFKLFHPLDQSIWAPRGPDKETIGAVIQPLPTSYLIFRAPSQAAGKCWMDALELSLRCSALLLRSASGGNSSEGATHSGRISHETQWSEADYEKHFDEHATAKHGKPSFLAKYIPATPPEKHCFAPNSDPKYFPRSPCPSPTPIFQQLYLAMGQWERILTESPENVEVLKKKCNYAMNSINKNINKHPMDNDNENTDETDDERSINGSPNKYELKKTSSLNILLDDEKLSKKLRRKSMPAEFIESVKKPVKKHFHLQKVVNKKYLDVDSQIDGGNMIMSGPETDSESDVPDGQEDEFPETPYVHCHEDEFGAAGEQVEELAEEHKSLIWFLVKQVRPGMDLSKVVLPTFILEPRSFLDKLSDSYYHADLLSKAVLEDDPFTRMKTVVQWYLSGFYKKPKGLKKPYNPILGETFRCYWEHPNGSRTFYIAEQVSHHPPVSAFYVTNRQDGFCISCSILAKSKFYGNSTSAVLNGTATLTLLPRGESYSLTVPYAHCKGILMGTLSMELGGKISIECENTGYRTELEFKLKPFLGGAEYTNVVSGRLKLGKETLASINGHWDSVIKIKDSRTGEESVLFTPSQEIRSKRLKRFSVPIESQANNESERLWQHVSAAIHRDDQVAATEEKTALEEAQREAAKERKATCTDWVPVHFQQVLVYGQWHYKYADLRPWDPRNDLRQYESNYRIQTKTRHQAPMVRTASIVSTEPLSILQAESRQSLAALKNSKRVLSTRKMSLGSTPDPAEHNSDSSQSDVNTSRRSSKILHSLENINKKLEEHSQKLATMQLKLERIAYAPKNDVTTNISLQNVVFIIVGIFIYAFLSWLLPKK